MRKNLNPYLVLSRTKPEPNLSAQSTRLCAVVSNETRLTNSIESYLNAEKMINNKLAYIIKIQYMYGLRISEVLSIRMCHIDRRNNIKVFGAKGSENRIINVAGIYNDLRIDNNSTRLLFDDYNRFFVYRYYKKLGFVYEHGKGFKCSVTHAPRHILLKSLESITDNIEEKARFIGHKSTKSTEHYVK
jgi:integrase